MKKFFEGWYYKQQADGKTLALIPGKSDNCTFIQVITDKKSYNIHFNMADYKKNKILRIGDNEFSDSGIKLNIKRDDILIHGKLKYTNLSPIKGDIMGPFRFFPLECRHGIISMKHDVSGEVILNGEKFCFDKGVGYIESDSGHSFPESYAWIHSNSFTENCSIMASVAKIPFAGFRFWGFICIVWIEGKEYRLSTYKGGKIQCCEYGEITLGQGIHQLKITVTQHKSQNLTAPKFGLMNRIIKESASCPAKFLFTENNETVFLGESKYASYEYAMSTEYSK